MKYFQSAFYSFTIWVLASIINGITSGLYLILSGKMGPEALMGSLVFSLVFSLPGIFLFWIYFMIRLYKHSGGSKLFIELLNAALLVAIFSGIIFYQFLGNEFRSNNIVLMILGIVATLIALFVHRGTFLSSFTNDNQHAEHEQI